MYFSVIVPVYGVEKYINKCVDSILAQSFSDFELILVNDGSLDNCPLICDMYAKKDSRVKVIHKQNGGLVSARKAGILKAGGKYVINIDGDDSITQDYFKEAYNICEKYNPDIISFAVNFVAENGSCNENESKSANINKNKNKGANTNTSKNENTNENAKKFFKNNNEGNNEGNNGSDSLNGTENKNLFKNNNILYTDFEPVKSGIYKGKDLKTIKENMLLTPQMEHMHYFLWAKVFKRELILPHQTEVDERISMGEDVTCLIPAYINAKSVYISSFAAYNCLCRNNSMSRSYKESHFNDIILGVKLLLLQSNNVNGYKKEYEKSVYRYAAFMFFVIFATAAKDGAKDVCEYSKKIWAEEFCQAFKNAEFGKISLKSKTAFFLLKRKMFYIAYYFLRICEKMKGNK